MREIRERLKREDETARAAEAQQGPAKEARARSEQAPDDSEGPAKKGKTRTTAKREKDAEAKKEG
ncbi:MAG TPA: hypothetical protein VJ837_04765, partial [Candidatus Paceibacterota bacterium]|nr:hypothetical protein [Candidatus Paceibacterota bacterium]